MQNLNKDIFTDEQLYIYIYTRVYTTILISKLLSTNLKKDYDTWYPFFVGVGDKQAYINTK